MGEPAVDPRRCRELRLKFLEASRATLIAYLKDKLADEDWHGVMDAAADLRELDVETRCWLDPL